MRFILAMVLNPEVQCKAQEEVDRVVATGQLPSLSEYATSPLENKLTLIASGFCDCSKGDMPYINAVIQEVFRWDLMLPVALPHSLTEDDEYQGQARSCTPH